MLAPTRSGSRFVVVGVVGFALFMDYLVYGLLIPLTPYSPARASSHDQSGLLYAGYSVGVLAATPLFGYLGDRIGCRRPMIIGVILSAAALALFWFASSFYLALLGRFFQGAAAAATWTAGLALIAERYPEKRVEMMGYALLGSTAGSLLGPLIGGLLYQVGGYHLPFAVTSVLVAADAGLCVFLLPREKSARREKSPDLRLLLRERSVLVAAAAVALAAIGWSIIEPLLPSQLERSGDTPAAIGLVFTIASLAYGASAPVVSWVSSRVPIRMIIAGGAVAMAIALPFLSLHQGAFAATIGLCVVSVCYAFMLNPTSAELGNAVDRLGLSCYAAVYAIYNIAYAVGQMAASSFASASASRLSFFQALLCVSGTLVLFLPLLLLRNRPALQASPQASTLP